MSGRKTTRGRASGEKKFIVSGSLSRALVLPRPDGSNHQTECRRDLREELPSLDRAVNYLLLCMKKIVPGSGRDQLLLTVLESDVLMTGHIVAEVVAVRAGIRHQWNVERSFVEGLPATPTKLHSTTQFHKRIAEARSAAAERFGFDPDATMDDDIPVIGRRSFARGRKGLSEGAVKVMKPGDWTTCPDCGDMIATTSKGRIRKHGSQRTGVGTLACPASGCDIAQIEARRAANRARRNAT